MPLRPHFRRITCRTRVAHCAVAVLAVLSFALTLRAQSAWTVTRLNLPGVNFVQSVAFGNGRFLASLGGTAGSPSVAWSTDGLTWQGSAEFTGRQGTVIFFGGYFYHAVDNGVWRSTDGERWQSVATSAAANTNLRYAATDGRGLVFGSGNTRVTSLFTSPDLLTWRETTPVPGATAPNLNPATSGLAAFARRYYVLTFAQVPGGSRTFADSTVDGLSWTKVPALDSATYIASGNGRLLAVMFQPNGAFTRSTVDGTTFTDFPFEAILTNGGRLGFAGGRFFLLGSLFASIDGRNWAALASATVPRNSQMNDIAYGNGRYVAIGYGPGPSATTDLVAVLAASAPPVIATGPLDRTVAAGAGTTFAVTIENPDLATTFLWRRDGTLLPGATSATYTIPSVKLADTGRYTVEIRNSLGSVSSDPAILTVVPAAQAGRLVNLSVLTALDPPDSTLTVGFVVGGAGTAGPKSVLVRAAGPSLASFGVANPLADPKLALFSPGPVASENDNWGGSPALSAIFAQVGAFAFLASSSPDAALSAVVARGDSSMKISSATPAAGSVIAEVYDATAPDIFNATTPRLVNVSVLKPLPAGGTLSAGFVISGATPCTVLIRVIGPTLASFGVADPLADPRLTLYRSGVAAAIGTNDNWAGPPALADAFLRVGAFALSPNSRDAALLTTLPPGNYTVQAAAPATTSGTALVEIYEVP